MEEIRVKIILYLIALFCLFIQEIIKQIIKEFNQTKEMEKQKKILNGVVQYSSKYLKKEPADLLEKAIEIKKVIKSGRATGEMYFILQDINFLIEKRGKKLSSFHGLNQNNDLNKLNYIIDILKNNMKGGKELIESSIPKPVEPAIAE